MIIRHKNAVKKTKNKRSPIMKIFNKQQLKKHYGRILEQNRKKILRGGLEDEYLISPNTGRT